LSSPVLLNLGYGNLVVASRVVAIVSPQSAPMRRLREEAEGRGKLVVLSAINPETIAGRLQDGSADLAE